MPNDVKVNKFFSWAGSPPFDRARPACAFLARAFVLGAMLPGIFMVPIAAAQSLPSVALSDPGAGAADNRPVLAKMVKVANFGQEASTPESQKLADWVVDSSDNNRLPFAIVDKVNARVFVFDAQGQLKGTTPVLLGLAVGDDSVPGIGQRKLSSIRPEERTTPAGRFVASLERDIHGQEVLWVDYETAVSLHPVVKGTPKERRAERLASASVLDKRISYGCINVPVSFYEKVVSPTFTGTSGIVYVLPETRPAREVFRSYDVQDPLRQQASADTVQLSGSAAR